MVQIPAGRTAARGGQLTIRSALDPRAPRCGFEACSAARDLTNRIVTKIAACTLEPRTRIFAKRVEKECSAHRMLHGAGCKLFANPVDEPVLKKV